MTTGVALFDAFDAGGRDAGAWEVQDGCNGHPQISERVPLPHAQQLHVDTSVNTVIGFALDGFPITGPEGRRRTTSSRRATSTSATASRARSRSTADGRDVPLRDDAGLPVLGELLPRTPTTHRRAVRAESRRPGTAAAGFDGTVAIVTGGASGIGRALGRAARRRRPRRARRRRRRRSRRGRRRGAGGGHVRPRLGDRTHGRRPRRGRRAGTGRREPSPSIGGSTCSATTWGSASAARATAWRPRTGSRVVDVNLTGVVNGSWPRTR